MDWILKKVTAFKADVKWEVDPDGKIAIEQIA